MKIKVTIIVLVLVAIIGGCYLFSSSYTAKSPKNEQENFIVLKISDKDKNIFLEGADDFKAVTFSGINLNYSFGQDKSIKISGVGTISYNANIIKISKEGIEVNGRSLSSDSINFVLRINGELQDGFIRNFE
ncbi:MAG: hypothetical protein WCT02_02625 [Candidatus Paceibacterota bacterium]|jgi:hypothetical protein